MNMEALAWKCIRPLMKLGIFAALVGLAGDMLLKSLPETACAAPSPRAVSAWGACGCSRGS